MFLTGTATVDEDTLLQRTALHSHGVEIHTENWQQSPGEAPLSFQV